MTRTLDGFAPYMVCALSPLGRDNPSCALYTDCLHPTLYLSLSTGAALVSPILNPHLKTSPTRLTLLKVGVLVMELRDGYQLSLGLLILALTHTYYIAPHVPPMLILMCYMYVYVCFLSVLHVVVLHPI